MSNTYLGQKGYTIPKNNLTSSELTKLKEELIAKPFVQGVQYGNQAEGFPIYRESGKKNICS